MNMIETPFILEIVVTVLPKMLKSDNNLLIIKKSIFKVFG